MFLPILVGFPQVVGIFMVGLAGKLFATDYQKYL